MSCKYIITNDRVENESSRLYEDLKEFYNDEYSEETKTKTLSDDIEYVSEYWYHYVHSDAFKQWFTEGKDYLRDELSTDELKLINNQGEPKLHTETFNGKKTKFFVNSKGDKWYIDNNDFAGFDINEAREIANQMVYYIVNHFNQDFENVEEVLTKYNDLVTEFIFFSVDKYKEENRKILKTYESEFKDLIRKELKDMSLTFQTQELNEDELDETEKTGDVVRKASVKVNSKDKASANVKLLISNSIPQIDSDGDYVFGKRFELPLFEKFGKVWTLLEQQLSNNPIKYTLDKNGNVDFEDRNALIENKIRELAVINQGYKVLADAYRDLPTKEKVEFNKAFYHKRVEYLKMLLQEEGNDKTKRINTKTIEDSRNNPKDTILSKWGEVVRLNYIVNDKVQLPKKELLKTQNLLIQEDIIGALKIVNGLGFGLHISAVERGVTDQLKTPYEVLRSFVSQLLGSRFEGQNAYSDKQNYVNPFTGDTNKFNEIAALQADYEGHVGESTTYGAKGLHWNYSLYEYISLVKDQIEQGDTTLLKRLAKTPYANNSLMIRKLKEGKISIKTFLQLQKQGKEAVDSSSIIEIDALLADMNRVLSDRVTKGTSVFSPIPPADKQTTLLIKGLDFYTTENNQYIDVFIDYIKDELAMYNHEAPGNVHFNKNKGENFKLFLFPELRDILIKDGEVIKDVSSIRPQLEEAIKNSVAKKAKELRDDILANYTNINNVINEDIIKTYLNIETLYKDYIVNSIISNVEFTKIFTGYPGFYKNIPDFFKRSPATQTDGIHLFLTKGDPQHFNLAVVESPNLENEDLTNDKHIQRVFDEVSKYDDNITYQDVKDSMFAYKSNTIADAQGWATIARARFILEKTKGFSEYQGKLMDKAERGELLMSDEIEDLQTTFQSIKGVHYQIKEDGSPIYVKYSLAVLIPSMVKGTQYQTMLDMMEDKSNDIQELVTTDGVKVGATNVSKIHDDKGNIIKAKLNPIRLDNMYYKIQQQLPTKGIKQSVLASQIQKNIFNNLSDMIINHPNAKVYNGKTAIEIFQEITDISKSILERQRTNIENKLEYKNGVFKEDKIKEIILSELKRDTPQYIINAIKKNIPLDNFPTVVERIQSAMSSYFKKLVEIPMNQASFIQISNLGSRSLSKKEASGIVFLKDIEDLTGPTVDTEGNVTKGQVLIPETYIKKIVPNYKELIAEEGVEGFLAMLPEGALEALGYRIPNQGMSSNDALEIVGLLPEELGDSVIVYNGLTTKTGSDFDIDKMYMLLPNLKFDKINNSIELETEGLKGDQNRLLQAYKDVLTSTATYMDMVTSIDKPTKRVQKYVGEDNKIYNNLDFFNAPDLLKKRIGLIQGKQGVGTDANHLVNHSLTQIYNVQVGSDNLYGIYDFNNDLKITDVLSGLLNAFVDIAKDDYILRANFIGTMLSPMIYLIRTGVPLENVIKFASQPVLKDEIIKENLKGSNYNQQFLPDKQIDKKARAMANSILSDVKKLDKMLKTPDVFDNLDLLNQAIIAKFNDTKAKSKNITELINATKFDVNGGGNNVAKHMYSLLQVYKVLTNEKLINVAQMFKSSEILGTRFKNGVQFLFEADKQLFFEANMMDKVFATYEIIFGENINTDNLESLNRYIRGKVIENLFYNSNEDLQSPISKEQYTVKDLFDKKLAKELNDLLKKYPDNKLLQVVNNKFVEGQAFFEISNLRNITSNEKDDIHTGWEDLLKREPLFAEKLIVKSFVQSGFTTGLGTFYEFIPPTYWAKINSQLKNAQLQTEQTPIADLAVGYAANNPNNVKYFSNKKLELISKAKQTQYREDVGKGVFQIRDENIVIYEKNVHLATHELLTGDGIVKIYKLVSSTTPKISKSLSKYKAFRGLNIKIEDTQSFDIIDYNYAIPNIEDNINTILNNQPYVAEENTTENKTYTYENLLDIATSNDKTFDITEQEFNNMSTQQIVEKINEIQEC